MTLDQYARGKTDGPHGNLRLMGLAMSQAFNLFYEVLSTIDKLQDEVVGFGVVEQELKGEIEKAKGMFKKKKARVIDQKNAKLKAKVLDLRAKLEGSD